MAASSKSEKPPKPKRALSYNSSMSRGSQSSGPDSIWDPDLHCIVGESKVSKEVSAKKAIRNARLLFEVSAQSQSPSKDYACLIVTEKGIIWSKWKITLRGFTSGTAPVPQPQEEAMSFTDFKCNDSLMDEVKRTFGLDTFHHIERIISGSNDRLSCTPEALMIHICTMLDLHSISRLSQVNRHLRRLCTSDQLWSALYAQHQGHPNTEICAVANDIGWKAVFYSSKLQLQKELSRRRKLPRHDSSIEEPGADSTAFLTQNI